MTNLRKSSGFNLKSSTNNIAIYSDLLLSD